MFVRVFVASLCLQDRELKEVTNPGVDDGDGEKLYEKSFEPRLTERPRLGTTRFFGSLRAAEVAQEANPQEFPRRAPLQW
jgi:hypothetical protein